MLSPFLVEFGKDYWHIENKRFCLTREEQACFSECKKRRKKFNVYTIVRQIHPNQYVR